MHRLFVTMFLICGCSDPVQHPQRPGVSIEIAGKLENSSLDEASGLAGSPSQAGLIWVINDDGPARLYAIDSTGAKRGKVKLADVRNVDWEDLASFRLDDTPYLLIADIGDNESKRDVVSLYVVAEPDLQSSGKHKARVSWRIDFSYPDGPRDAESVAVDAENELIYVLSKRDIPATLYQLPLRPETDAVLIATRLGSVTGIPKPSRQDVEFAPKTKDWYWQPTALDISADNLSATILTYGAVYYFERGADEDWLAALRKPSAAVRLGKYRGAESVAFDDDNHSVYVTFEKKHASILRIDFGKL